MAVKQSFHEIGPGNFPAQIQGDLKRGIIMRLKICDILLKMSERSEVKLRDMAC